PRINLPEGDIDAAFCKTAGFIKGPGAGFGNAVEGLAVGAAEDDEVAGEQSNIVPGFVAVFSTADAKDSFITDGQRHNRSERSFISILVHTHRGTRRIKVNQRHIGPEVIDPRSKLLSDIGSCLQSTLCNIQEILRDRTYSRLTHAVHIAVGLMVPEMT